MPLTSNEMFIWAVVLGAPREYPHLGALPREAGLELAHAQRSQDAVATLSEILDRAEIVAADVLRWGTLLD